MRLAVLDIVPVSRVRATSSEALACYFALRLVAPRRLTGALAAAASSEDALTLLPNDSVTAAARSAACAARELSQHAGARRAPLGIPVTKFAAQPCTRTKSGAVTDLVLGGAGCPLRKRPEPAPLLGGAVPRSRKASVQARASEEDTPRRPARWSQGASDEGRVRYPAPRRRCASGCRRLASSRA